MTAVGGLVLVLSASGAGGLEALPPAAVALGSIAVAVSAVNVVGGSHRWWG
jgi:hypothetical protein